MSINTDYKPLVATFKKDTLTLSQWLQCMLLIIHQYKIHILYKLGPSICIADCLLRQTYKEGKEIEGMKLNIDAISISTAMTTYLSIQDIQEAHKTCCKSKRTKEHIVRGWSLRRDEIKEHMWHYFDLQEQTYNEWWNHHKRQMGHHSSTTTTESPQKATQQPYRHWKKQDHM